MSKREAIWWAVVVLVALPLIVPSFTLHKEKGRILATVSGALGREVSASAVHLVLFPWPGFKLVDVRVAGGPAFGESDMMRAGDAVATVRLWSLLGGQLEFSSVRLDDADLNLVRNAGGAWNFSSFLDRTAAGMPQLRPTNAAPALHQPRFPYLEVRDARVNFTLGMERQRFYLSNVNASLALEGGRWRFEADFQPERTDLTDLNLSDMGTVQVNGYVQAARRSFRDLPFDLSISLRHSYLAASSALLLGESGGVDGVVDIQSRVRGSGQQFQISGNFQAQSVRRWDLLPPMVTVHGSFAANYFPGTDLLTIQHFGDPGYHALSLQGEVRHLLTHPQPQLGLAVRNLPASDLLIAARAVKSDLPRDLSASGSVQGKAAITGWSSLFPAGSGQFQFSAMRLAFAGNRLDLPLFGVQWSAKGLQTGPVVAHLQLNSAKALAVPLTFQAQSDSKGYALQVRSPAVDGNALRVAGEFFGLHSPIPSGLQGVANQDWSLAGSWQNFRNPIWTGSANWVNATFHSSSLPVPVELSDFQLTASGVNALARFNARFAGAAWTGTLRRGQLPPNLAPSARARQTRRAKESRAARAARTIPTSASASDTTWNLSLLTPHLPVPLLLQSFKPASRHVLPAWLEPQSMVHLLPLGLQFNLRLQAGVADWGRLKGPLDAQVSSDGKNWQLSHLIWKDRSAVITAQGKVRGGEVDLSGNFTGLPLPELLNGKNLNGQVSASFQFSGDALLAAPAQVSGVANIRYGSIRNLKWGRGIFRFRSFSAPYTWTPSGIILGQGRVVVAAKKYTVSGSVQPASVDVMLQNGSTNRHLGGSMLQPRWLAVSVKNASPAAKSTK